MELWQTITSVIIGGLLALIALVGYVTGWWKSIRKWFLAPRKAKEAKARYEKAYIAYEEATQEFMNTIDRFNHYTYGLSAVCSEIIAENLSGAKADAVLERIQKNIELTWDRDACVEMKRHNEEDLKARRKLREVNQDVQELKETI